MTSKNKKVLVSVPEPLLKRLDKAAKKQSRNRSTELCLRLVESLRVKKVERLGQDRRSASGGA